MDEPLCRFLDWDSEFFGARIGRISAPRLTPETMQYIAAWCQEQRIDCLYFLCEPDDDESVKLAEANRFHLVDVRIVLSWQSSSPDCHTLIEKENLSVRPARLDDLADLQKIAENAYEATRFYYDQRFARERVKALYCEWIARSYDALADVVLVAMYEDCVAGFITCQRDSLQVGRIGLVGVAHQVRGAGVGRLLVNFAQNYFKQEGVREVLVATQGRNLSAQRLYQKSGFLTRSLNFWYHKWLTDFEKNHDLP